MIDRLEEGSQIDREATPFLIENLLPGEALPVSRLRHDHPIQETVKGTGVWVGMDTSSETRFFYVDGKLIGNETFGFFYDGTNRFDRTWIAGPEGLEVKITDPDPYEAERHLFVGNLNRQSSFLETVEQLKRWKAETQLLPLGKFLPTKPEYGLRVYNPNQMKDRVFVELGLEDSLQWMSPGDREAVIAAVVGTRKCIKLYCDLQGFDGEQREKLVQTLVNSSAERLKESIVTF